MLKLKKVAVTGGLSCGKTTVLHLFQKLGAFGVSADDIVHQLLASDSKTTQKVIEWLGADIVTHGKIGEKIDRKKIAEKVFSDPAKIKQLESLLHPEVGAALKRTYEEICHNPLYALFVAEIPLLFEAGMEKDFDVVLTVACKPELAKGRFSGTPDDFQQRNQLQMPLDEKIQKSTFVIYNNGSLEELQTQISTLFNELKSYEP
jgi:dephospho-CoA kinase